MTSNSNLSTGDDDWEQHPFFLRELPKDPSKNPYISALAEIAYEGKTPREIAVQLKERGNEALKRASANKEMYYEALKCYDDGLEQKCGDVEVDALLHLNKAAVLLLLGNYRSVVEECEETIKLCSDATKLLKAFYRKAKALNLLKKFPEALEATKKGLLIDPKNSELLQEQSKAITLGEEERKRTEETQKRREREREEKEGRERKLREKLEERKYRMGDELVELAKQFKEKIQFDQKTRAMIFPVVFLYPEHSQSDIIERFSEEEAFGDHLQEMFPPTATSPDWDPKSLYTLASIHLYFKSSPKSPNETSKWVEINLSSKLKTVLKREDYIIPVVPTFYVLIQSKFSKEFLSSSAAV